MAALVIVALTAVGLLVYAVSAERAQRFDPYDVQTGTAGSERADVAAEPASIWVNGAPFGATLRVDADSVGTVPMTLEDIEPGDYMLRLESGGRAVDTLVSVRAGESAAVFIRLDDLGDGSDAVVDVEASPPAREPAPPAAVDAAPPVAPATGLLRILSEPSGAMVRLDGVAVGTTPLVLPEVEAGRRTVGASMAGHESREESVEVRAGRDQMLRLSLPAVATGPGTIEVLARPWGSIYIDGALKKRNTDVVYRIELPAGTHEVRVVHPTFGTQTRQVTVGVGQSVMEVFDLTVGSSDGDA